MFRQGRILPVFAEIFGLELHPVTAGILYSFAPFSKM